MARTLRILPSILASDFARLADEIASLPESVDVIHVDVMDGHFVPNLTVGPVVVSSIRKATRRLLDVHLMIADPAFFAPRFAAAGADRITFHVEAVRDPFAVAGLIRDAGRSPGVTLRPGTPPGAIPEGLPVDRVLVMTVEPGFGGQAFIPEAVDKIAILRRRLPEATDLQVDGGITRETIGRAAAAGANEFIAGSAVFGSADRPRAVGELLDAARAGKGG